mmetsp:Transcript_77674/g.215831  ORF Transcript_77674/g.215831 Transcript_77674/m.215831 type:complete len:87 (+) Transcript_77674:2202-2462(+)
MTLCRVACRSVAKRTAFRSRHYATRSDSSQGMCGGFASMWPKCKPSNLQLVSLAIPTEPDCREDPGGMENGRRLAGNMAQRVVREL